MVKLGKQKHTKTESLMGNITLLNDSRSSSIELSVPKTKHLLAQSSVIEVHSFPFSITWKMYTQSYL